ncbi:MAG TPA: tetratricopeptide repeat protein, partial [Myxococcota bacterium]
IPRTMTPLATPTPVTLSSEPIVAALPRPATNANIAAAVGRAPPPTTTMTALALLLNRAGRAEDEGDLAGAVELLREAVVLEPGSAVAYNRLGVLLARTRDLPGAVKALDRALAIKPDDATIRSNHAKIVSIAERKKPSKRR